MARFLVFLLVTFLVASMAYGQVGGQAGCSSAYTITTPLSPTPFSIFSDNTNAQVLGKNSCRYFLPSSSGSVWYVLSPEPGSVVTLDTCQTGTNYETSISVYSGTCTDLKCVTTTDPLENSKSKISSCTQNRAVAKFFANQATYLIAIGGVDGSKGNFQLAISASAALPSLGCYEATNIVGPFVNDPVYIVTTNQNGAALPPSVPECGYITAQSHIVWYTATFIPGVPAIISTCTTATSSVDAVVSVYSGPDCASLACVDTEDAGYNCPSNSLTVIFTPDSEQAYHIAVSGYGSSVGTIGLSIVQYPTCLEATPFTIEPSASITGLLSPNGPLITEEPCDYGYTGVPAEFFELIFTNYTEVTLSTCNPGTTFFTILVVYSGTCDNLSCVTYAEQSSCPVEGSTLTFTPVAGTKYFAVVTGAPDYDGYYYGNFVLTASQ